MKNLRILFMGTPDFAVSILKTLIDNNYNIVGVVTAPDKPSGRGRKMNESAVKKYASRAELTIYQPINLKSDAFIEQLKRLEIDLAIVVAFRMLPKKVWTIPKKGTFNLHASLLPDYRGAAPIHWAIINGETKTGVTTFFIDEKIDTGEIILNKEVKISENETVGSLHDKLMDLGTNLVLETVDIIENNNYVTKKQPASELKKAPKLTKENTRINWQNSITDIYNFIRGLNPFPAAWTVLKNGSEEINAKLYDVSFKNEEHDFTIGKIDLTENDFRVAVENGFIIIEEIKLAGKKKMDSKSLLNGFHLEADAKML